MWDKVFTVIAWIITLVIVLSFWGAIFWIIGKLIILMLGINLNWTFQYGVLTYIAIIVLKGVLTSIEMIFLENKEEEK